MKLTRKSLKLTKKTLFSFRKQTNVQSFNSSYDPVGVTAGTPGASTSVMQF